ncbi:hypothetical protein Hanom_Chr10g00957241 [Helianthus anomalus]
MRKNKPLDKSCKTGQTSGTKMAFYSIVKKQNIYTWAKIVYMVSDYVQCFGCFVYELLEPVGIKEATGCNYTRFRLDTLVAFLNCVF